MQAAVEISACRRGGAEIFSIGCKPRWKYQPVVAVALKFSALDASRGGNISLSSRWRWNFQHRMQAAVEISACRRGGAEIFSIACKLRWKYQPVVAVVNICAREHRDGRNKVA